MRVGRSSSDFDIGNLASLEERLAREEILLVDHLDKDDWSSLCTNVSVCNCYYLGVSFVKFQLVDPNFEFLKHILSVCNHVKVLSLAYNEAFGEDWNHVLFISLPKLMLALRELNWKILRSLSLVYFSIEGKDLGSLMTDNLHLVQELDLSHNDLGQIGTQIFFQWLSDGTQKNLRYLNLSYCQLRDDSGNIGKALRKYRELVVIELFDNVLSGVVLEEIMEAMLMENDTQRLDVSGNASDICQKRISSLCKSLCRVIRENNKLYSLDLENNSFESHLPETKEVWKAVGENTSLTCFGFHVAKSLGNQASLVKESLAQNTCLKEITIGMDFGKEEASVRALFNAITQHPTLKKLSMNYCNVQSVHVPALCELLKKGCLQLVEMDYGNHLVAQDFIMIGPALEESKLLELKIASSDHLENTNFAESVAKSGLVSLSMMGIALDRKKVFRETCCSGGSLKFISLSSVLIPFEEDSDEEEVENEEKENQLNLEKAILNNDLERVRTYASKVSPWETWESRFYVYSMRHISAAANFGRFEVLDILLESIPRHYYIEDSRRPMSVIPWTRQRHRIFTRPVKRLVFFLLLCYSRCKKENHIIGSVPKDVFERYIIKNAISF